MAEHRIDTLARVLTSTPSRRRTLSLLAGAALGGLSALFGWHEREIGEADTINSQRRRRKRDCRSGYKRCRGKCIPKGNCCTDDNCSGSRICEKGKCICPNKKPRLCHGTCIAKDKCCTKRDCKSGYICNGRHVCVLDDCATGTKRCGDACIPEEKCCNNQCPKPKVCNARQTCVCPDDSKPCKETCIPKSECCESCQPGTACRDGECTPPGPALYPDLQTMPVSDIHFEWREENGTQILLLRFGNTVWNAGEGRLEVQGEPMVDPDEPTPVYQNLYDAPVGGNLVEHRRIGSDIRYHPGHEHFHFADFASYMLLGKESSGQYTPMQTEAIKVSFCVLDTDQISGDYPRYYTDCSPELQGLSVGWSDTYGADVQDQWIVLGEQMLPEGDYAIQSIADPKDVLGEGGGNRERNNTSVTYFTVKDGQIEDEIQVPMARLA